jgi:hypothetical protein
MHSLRSEQDVATRVSVVCGRDPWVRTVPSAILPENQDSAESEWRNPDRAGLFRVLRQRKGRVGEFGVAWVLRSLRVTIVESRCLETSVTITCILRVGCEIKKVEIN